MSVNGLSHGKLASAQIAPLLDRKPAQNGDPTAVAQQRISAKLDTDGDGALSVTELAKLEKGGHGKNGRPAQAILAAQAPSTEPAAMSAEPPAARRFGPKTLDALIKNQTVPTPESIAEKLVAAIDGDDDGAFSLDELKDALPGKSGQAKGRAAHAERAFDRLDGDGDGKVTVAELALALGATPPAPLSIEEPPPPVVEETPPPVELAENPPVVPVTDEVIDPPLQEPSANG
ncbi:EF-hand domain-containing protein [Phenylobacterium sp.]|uniref:EF-hand domain-containing protein n=1 Tax=Phenylobacterium sp. TaxID=1871053 RepID=UPI002FCB0B79